MSTPTTAPTLRPVSIAVTAERIAAGACNACYDCPVAVAIDAVLRPGYRANVTAFTLIIVGPNLDSAAILDLPPAAVHFIGRFDKGETVAPFTFVVELPSEVLA